VPPVLPCHSEALAKDGTVEKPLWYTKIMKKNQDTPLIVTPGAQSIKTDVLPLAKKLNQGKKRNKSLLLFLIIFIFIVVGFFIDKHYSRKTAPLKVASDTEQKIVPTRVVYDNINHKQIEFLKELDKRTTTSQNPDSEWATYNPKCKAIKEYFIGKFVKAIYYPSLWKVKEDPSSTDMVNDKQEDYECTIMFGYPNVGGRQSLAEGQVSEIRITASYVNDATASAQEYITRKYNTDKEWMKKYHMDMEFEVEKIYLGDKIDAVKVISSSLPAEYFDWYNKIYPTIEGNYQIIIKDGDRKFEISFASVGLHSQNLSTFKDFIDKLRFGNGS
jgi:uncharacterized protein (UPF0333 family)